MGSDVIKSLKSIIADLTYVLFIISKEFELLIQHSNGEQISHELHSVIADLKESNNEIIRLYHEIQKYENDLQNQWYDNIEDVNNLQNRIGNLHQSTEALITGNDQFLENIHKLQTQSFYADSNDK